MTSTIKRILLLTILCLVVGIKWMDAQETPLYPVFNFETFELPSGERGNSVQAIAQDSFGFMWFGSQYGLHRWDGYSFKTYLKDPEDTTSIASNYIECLHAGTNGSLWIGFFGNGLDRFDYESETFHHVVLDTPNQKQQSRFVSVMTEDQNGHLWIGTSAGLYRLNTGTNALKLFEHDPNDPNSLSWNICRSLLVDSKGTLWVGTGFPWGRKPRGGLNRYRPESDDFERFLHDPNDENSLINPRVSAIFEDSKNNFWVGTSGGGLHLMDRYTGTLQRLQCDPGEVNQLCGPFQNEDPIRHVRFILEDQNQKIWIGGAWGAGLKYYDPETGFLRDYVKDESDYQSLPEQNPWAMMQSKDGTYWVASNGPTWKVFKFRETSFEYFALENDQSTVYSFSESKDGNIWLGTDQSGLLQFDRRTKSIRPFERNTNLIYQGNQEEEVNDFHRENLLNFFLKTVEGKDGKLWTRKYLPLGLYSLDPESGDVTHYQHLPGDETSIGRGRVTDIMVDQKEQIWSLTSAGDLNLYLPDENHFIRYRFYHDGNDNMELYSLMTLNSDGKIWIAGSLENNNDRSPFLKQFDPATGKFNDEHTSVFDNDPVMQNEVIHRMLNDQNGNLWICSDSKLIKFNPATGETKSYRAADLGMVHFKAMVMDRQWRLWLYGNKITVFDPESEASSSFVTSFTTEPDARYTQYIFMDSKGLIYFGGKSGFQVLEPRKVSPSWYVKPAIKNKTPHEVTVMANQAAAELPLNPVETLIRDFEFLEQSDSQHRDGQEPINILTTEEIELKYNQNAFRFHFSALDFNYPETNLHEFMLEGYDDQWRAAGSEPVATYVKVPPGDYTFKVRGATLRSPWGPETSIDVSISPPFWATWWAYLFYGLVVAGILYAFYYFQVNKKLDRAEAHRLKELDNVKTRLYTNITHEFRTPLTVISGMAAQMKENPKEWFSEGIGMIQRNSTRLLDLVNQMLDLSKLESGKMAIEEEQGDMVTYLKYIVESFHSFAEAKGIQIHFHAEEDEILMDFDHEKIQQVMSNLLSNAVKFTHDGGHVYVRAEIDKPDRVKVTVRDTGDGISEDELPYIFDRFYQVDATATRHGEGTGIGLSLVRELIKLMGGQITAKSKIAQGTEFQMTLPIKRQAEMRSSADGLKSAKVGASSPVMVGATAIAAASLADPVTGLQGKPQVLLIEDNPDVVAYIASCLKDDYEIKVGQDGQEGIEIALENVPDLIVTDVMMPFKDGFQVCKELKTDERTSHIPIIMLTAKADIESKLEGLEQGADAYLAKPFHKEELQLRIKKLLESRKNLQRHYLSVAGLTEGTVVIKDIPEVAQIEDQFVQKARQAVEDRLDDFEFTVEDFCRAMTLSHSQLHRKLKALTGYSAQKFIRYIRLTKAKELLDDDRLSITAVAFDTGFNDPNYFSRVFRKEFGVTPSEWREVRG